MSRDKACGLLLSNAELAKEMIEDLLVGVDPLQFACRCVCYAQLFGYDIG